MLKFSLPVIIGGSVLAVGATLGTVAVAMPGGAVDPVVAATDVATPSPVDTGTGTGDWVPLVDQSQREVIPGYRLQDLPAGLTTHVTSTGFYVTYSGPCVSSPADMTMWSNVPAVWKSRGGGACGVGKPTYRMMSITWSEDTRNSYCYSPLGAQSAYRAEIFGLVSEWVPIPESFKNCVNGQAPEGVIPTPSGVVLAPVAAPTLTPAPVPSVAPSVAASPSASASPSPTGSPTP